MEEEKDAEETCEHAYEVGIPRLTLPVLRFFINARYNEAREVPESEVHPGGHHQNVGTYLEAWGGDVNEHFEDAYGEIGNIVQNHDCRTDWQVVDNVGEEDQGEGQKVMKDVFGEVVALAIENNRIAKFIQVVRKFEDVEVVHHAWQLLARVVKEEKWSLCFSSNSNVEEVTIITKHYWVETDNANNVHR